MKTLLSAFFSFVALHVFAQTNVVPGKLYTTDNKVIDAYFQVTAFEGTPQQFSYTTEVNGPIVRADAASIKKIELSNGTVYESHFIEVPVIAKHYLERNKADYDFAGNWLRAPAFVERVIEGKISLYQFKDRYEFPHFFFKRENDTAITLLPNNEFVNESGAIEKDNAYKNLLVFLSQQYCTSSPIQVDGLKYALKPMIKTFTALNRCAGSEVNAHAFLNEKKETIDFGVLAGVLSSRLGFRHYERSVTPTFGAYMDITPGKMYKNYKLSLEAAYQSYKGAGDSVIYAINHSQTHVQFSMFSLNPVARFYVGRKAQSTFVEGGLSFVYVANYKLTTTTKDLVFNSVQTVGSEGDKSLFYGVVAGAGYDFQRLSLHARYGLMLHAYGDYIKNYVGLVAKFRINKR